MCRFTSGESVVLAWMRKDAKLVDRGSTADTGSIIETAMTRQSTRPSQRLHLNIKVSFRFGGLDTKPIITKNAGFDKKEGRFLWHENRFSRWTGPFGL